MRIGIDATCLPLLAAGASRYITGLLHGLAKVSSRHEYFIFIKSAHGALLPSLPANMHLVSLPNFPRPMRVIYQHLLAGLHAQRLQLDVWHGTHYSLPRFARDMALVSTFHDLSFFEFSGFFSKSRLFYFQSVMADAAQRAEMIVCVSNATREALHRHFPVNGRAITVHSGVDQTFFMRLSAEEIARACRDLKIQRPYILFLSTIERHKNLPLALEALSILRQRHDLHLVIAGQPGSGWPEASEAIHKLGLVEAVHTLGYVPEEKLPALYQGARLLALPSIVEGFGFPLLEAMAGGIPVFAAQSSDADGRAAYSATAEVVNHPAMLGNHNAGQWAEQIEKLIYDEPLRRELSAYAVERASQFSWQTTAERMVEIYESVALNKKTLIPSNGSNGILISNEKKNGKAHHIDEEVIPLAVIAAVLRTLIYADMFDYPLRNEEICSGLLECSATLHEVNAALAHLHRKHLIDHSGEWWHLAGRGEIVAERQRRGEYTRKLWMKNARLIKLICRFPFVKGVAISGAGSFENCQPSSSHFDKKIMQRSGGEADDIDLFIIADQNRLWFTYASLVFLLKILGKRKLICLNYLIGHRDIAIPAGPERDFFVAHQIAFLKPLRGRQIFEGYFSVNRWINEYLPQRSSHAPLTPAGLSTVPEQEWLGQSLCEKILHHRLFDFIEKTVFRFYSRHIMRLAGHQGSDAVEVSTTRIKLFTNNHRHRLRDTLAQRFEKTWSAYIKTKERINNATAVKV